MNYIFIILMLFVAACSEETVNLPDHRADIDKNAAEIELLKASEKVQNSRLDALELRADSLEARMTQAEQAIDSNSDAISELFSLVDNLDSELSSLRSEFYHAVAQLRKADRRNKRQLMMQMSQLRRKLCREIRDRQLADSSLQSQIDNLESELSDLEDTVNINAFASFIGFLFLNNKINNVESSINYQLDNLDSRLDSVENSIVTINQDITSINGAITNLTNLVNGNISDIQDLQDVVSNSSDCELELRDLREVETGPFWNRVTRTFADIYAVCSEGEYRLQNNAQLD